MKKIYFLIILLFISTGLYAQHWPKSTWSGGSGNGFVVVSDTTNVDKSTGRGYYYDGQYWLGTGTHLKAIPISKMGTAGQVLYTDGTNYYWGDPANETWYGVSWDEKNDTYTRLGSLKDSSASATIPDADLPVQSLMRRCLLKNDGTVYKYLRSDNSNYYEDGSPANLNGPYQVMVQIHKFYYAFHFDGVDSIITWKISLDSLAGFQRHPAFIKNGEYVDYRYIGAYEASLWDSSAADYVDSADVVTALYATGDTLCSVAGTTGTGRYIYPKENEYRSAFRAAALHRGAGWREMDYDLASAVQLLYLVEYASFNSQSKIGNGRTNITSTNGWIAGGYIGRCGLSNNYGNGTANHSTGDSTADFMSYRGIENFYGDVWNFVDGININDHIAYISNTQPFVDNSNTGYTQIGILASASNYQKYLINTMYGFLPDSVGASSPTYITDYYWGNIGWRVVLLGGGAYTGVKAGAFCVNANNGSTTRDTSIGGRLCF